MYYESLPFTPKNSYMIAFLKAEIFPFLISLKKTQFFHVNVYF